MNNQKQTLIRLTANSLDRTGKQGIFEGIFNDGILIKPNSQLALQSCSLSRDQDSFLVNSANNRLESIQGDFYCFGASLMLPIIYYYIPNLIKAKNIIDDDKSKEGLSYVNFDVEIINSKKINFLNNNFVVTAVATKLATRNIIKKLSDVKAMNIISPLNTL